MSVLRVDNHEPDIREFYLDCDFLYASGSEQFFNAVCTHLSLPRELVVRLYQQYDEDGELLNPETEEPEAFEAREKLEVNFVLALGERYRIDEVWDDKLLTLPTETAIERTNEEIPGGPPPLSFAEYRELWVEYYGDLDLTAVVD